MTKSIVEVIHELGFAYEASQDEFVTYTHKGNGYNEQIRVLIDAVRGIILIERDRGEEDVPVFQIAFNENDPLVELVLTRLTEK